MYPIQSADIFYISPILPSYLMKIAQSILQALSHVWQAPAVLKLLACLLLNHTS